MQSLVSIIIPVRNGEAFIKRALDSVASQTHQDWEVCMALNRCTDRTKDIVCAHRIFSRCKLVEIDGGPPASSRNAALRLATGDFIAFLDADDWWQPSKLKTCLQTLAREKADLVWHDNMGVHAPDNREIPILYKPLRRYYPNLLFMGNRLATSSIVLKNVNKRHADPLIVFDESAKFTGTEDFKLWATLARQNFKFVHISAVLGFYFVHPNATSGNIAMMVQNASNVVRHFMDSDPKLTWWDKVRMRCFLFFLQSILLRHRLRSTWRQRLLKIQPQR